MKKLLLLSSLIFVAASGFATHLMGGQLTSRQLSGLTYEITLTLYRDSVGIPISGTQPIRYTHIASGVLVQQSAAHSGALNFLNGVEQYIYVDTITFAADGAYKISWYDCCRNGAILNLPSPLGNSFVLTNYLLVDTVQGNSSPVFLNPPVVLAQVNDTFYYNPLPFDADGDSIAWSIDIPQDGSPSSSNPISGYTAPFASAGGAFSMDSISGEITWIPNTLGHFVTSFIIEEFRNGVKIGEIRRDMQYIVVDVPGNGNRAYIDTQGWPLDANNNFRFDIQVNTPFSLSVIAHDDDGDQLVVDANGEPFLLQNPSNWTNLTTGPGISENLFTWNTTNNEMRTAPYFVVFRIFETHANVTLVRDQTVQFRVGNFTSVSENNSTFSVGNIYPVPTSGGLYIPITVEKSSELKLKFINKLGQEVKSFDKRLNVGQNLLYFNDLNLPAGIYFVNINIDGEQNVRKLIME